VANADYIATRRRAEEACRTAVQTVAESRKLLRLSKKRALGAEKLLARLRKMRKALPGTPSLVLLSI